MSRDVIFIFPGGRNGSSALTRVLSLSGCTLPESVLGSQDINPRGVWEPADATKLNLEFMIQHSWTMSDPSMNLEIEIDEREKEDLIRRIQAFITGCPPGPMLVIKCAGLLDLFDFWSEAASRAGFSVKVVIPLRRPQEVLASAAAAGWAQPVEAMNVVWLKRALLAEHVSRDLPRAIVEYPNLLRDWRGEIARVAKALSIDLNGDNSAIDKFLTPDLHRQRCSGPIIETFAYSWISRVYSILSVAAQDGPIDLAALDEIYEAYRINERAFRIAGDNSRSGPNDLQTLRETLEKWPIWRLGHDF